MLAAPQEQQDTSSRGQRYAEDGVPAGRIYEIHVFSFGLLGPIAYDLTLSTDPNEPNNSVLTATDWSPPGCDFSGTLGLDGSDIDYFAFPASGSSVEVQAFFDPGRNLQVSLDGVQGSQGADFGDRETQVISGCGLEPSFVTVSGDPGAYDLCIKQVPIEDSCSLVDQFIPFAGTGYFTFQRTNPFVPGGVIEGTKPLNRHMFARLLSETGTDVTWEVLGTVEYGAGFNQLFRGEMVIPRPNPTTPFGFGPLAAGTPLLFEAVPGRVAWFQVAPVGVGEALFTGPDNAIESFDVMSQGLQWNASRPDDQATLVVQAGRDGDRDGVRDDVELETGTDPTLADTDGDGLVDGVEDANGNGLVDPGETDPRLEDTDGDGVSDGIEAGVVTPGASYAPLTSRDADPYTFTDPTTIDTDGDGRSDGVEDANGNGRQDPGETSPNVPDDFGNDPDGDGFADSADNCPAVYNPAQTDSDGDGEGDACDPADAVVNAADVFSTPGCWPACGPGDFPLDLGVIRSFVFLVPTGRQVEEVQISGTWGDVDSFDSTAPVELHLDGVMVAECLTSDPCWLEDGQFVDWSFSFRDQGIPDIAALFADGRAELTAVQNDVISVILSNLVLTVFVPEPGSTLLLTTGLLGLVGLARGRRGRGRMGRVGSADRQIKRPFPYHR